MMISIAVPSAFALFEEATENEDQLHILFLEDKADEIAASNNAFLYTFRFVNEPEVPLLQESMQIIEVPEDNPPMIDIAARNTPLFGPGRTNSWALLNLILSIIAIIIAFTVLIRLFIRENRENERNEIYTKEKVSVQARAYALAQGETITQDSENEKEKEPEYKKSKLLFILLSIVSAMLGGIIFVLTQDMRLPIAFIDRWTIMHVILVIIGLISCILALKKVKDEDDSPDVVISTQA